MAKYNVVSVMVGDYDNVPENLPHIGEDFSFTIIRKPSTGDREKDVRLHRDIKLKLVDFIPAKMDEYIVYMDSSMIAKLNPDENLWYEVLSPLEFTFSDLLIKIHPEYNSYREEAEACIRLKKDDPNKISVQINTYRLQGIPEYIGHAETGFFAFQKGNTRVLEFFYRWNKLIKSGSYRDQISFDAALFQYPLRICWVTRKQIDKLAPVTKHNSRS